MNASMIYLYDFIDTPIKLLIFLLNMDDQGNELHFWPGYNRLGPVIRAGISWKCY